MVPLLPELHQAFAEHNHVLCAQHHRIEDAGLKRIRVLRFRSSADFESSLTPLRTGTLLLDDTPPCVLSNLNLQGQQTTFIQIEVPIGLSSSHTPIMVWREIPPRDPLSVAPKHSPPTPVSI
ncbi:MAG: hypothetical protein GYA21_14710 [Myxococcales bacterium]|nr:hypothetical protein [Myxococcales bacterium]